MLAVALRPADLSRALEPHLHALHRLSRRLTASRSGAEALAQEALVSAFQRRRRLRDGRRARSFLLSLALSLHKAHPEAQGPLLVIDPDELLLALRELPGEQATAIWLCEVERLDDAELGEVLGLPAAGARSLLALARKALAAGEKDVPAALRAHPLASELAPPSLEGTLRGLTAGAELAVPRGLLRTLLVPALAALVAAAAVGLAKVPGSEAAIPDFIADEVAAQHIRALSRGAPCEKESSDPQELARWLQETLGRAVVVPSPADADLLCARQGWLFGQPTPAVLYRKGETTVTLFLPAPGSAAAAATARDFGHCAPGTSGQTVCVLEGPDGPRLLAGELPAGALAAIIRAR